MYVWLPRENAEHYLLFCTNYDTARTNTILTLQPKDILTRTLLYGDSTLTCRENELIINKVF